MRLCDRDGSGCVRLRLCQVMSAAVPGDGCRCGIAMAAAVRWLRLRLCQVI